MTIGVKSVSITMRTYLSMSYLTSAALLARKAHDIESDKDWQSVDWSVLPEHEAYATGAIMMGAAAVEAFVNELFAECRDAGAQNQLRIAPEKAALVGRIWNDVPRVERDPVMDKYDLVLRLLDLPTLERKSEPYQAAVTLFDLRNRLMHYKLVSREAGILPTEQKLDSFEKKLKSYFDDSRLAGPGHPYFPHQTIGHGAAAWSVKTAVAFLDHFCGLLSAKAPYEHIRSTFATQ